MLADKTQISLVHECGGLQRMCTAFAMHQSAREPTQFFVDQRKQRIKRGCVAMPRLLQRRGEIERVRQGAVVPVGDSINTTEAWEGSRWFQLARRRVYARGNATMESTMFEAPKLVDDLNVTLARYAVFGHPVGHSKSPVIHRAFAHQLGIALRYDAIDVAPGTLATALSRFAAEGGVGANITLPLKAEAFAAARAHSAHAKKLGVANTLAWRGDHWYADNTDGAGLVHDLIENLGVALGGRHIIVLGAGGAARGILQPIFDAHPAAITISNRTMARAEALAQEFAAYGPIRAVAPGDLGSVAGEARHAADVIINATAYGMADRPLGEPPCPTAIFTPATFVYDLVYALADEPTPFMRLAAAAGATRSADGLGMLIEQAAESFFLWRGVRPNTAHVFPLLRNLAV